MLVDVWQVAETMGLQKLSRRWRVQECSATLGTGVEQSVDWLCMAEGMKVRKQEASMLSEENARIFASEWGGLEGTTSGEYVEGRKYTVTKMAGKGKGQQLRCVHVLLACSSPAPRLIPT